MLIHQSEHCYGRNDGGNGLSVTCPCCSCSSNSLFTPGISNVENKANEDYKMMDNITEVTTKSDVCSGLENVNDVKMSKSQSDLKKSGEGGIALGEALTTNCDVSLEDGNPLVESQTDVKKSGEGGVILSEASTTDCDVSLTKKATPLVKSEGRMWLIKAGSCMSKSWWQHISALEVEFLSLYYSIKQRDFYLCGAPYVECFLDLSPANSIF